MGFDPSSAQPETGGGFDSTTAAPDQSAPAQNKGGFWRNVGAGLEEFPGAMLDALKSHGTAEMVTGPNDPTWNDPDLATPVSHAIGKVTGLDPASVPANTFAEKTGRVLGGALPALAFPEAEAGEGANLASQVTSRLANAPIETLGRRAATLGGTALGSTAAGEAVPDNDPVLKSAVSVLGAIAGGAATEAPSLVRAATAPVKRFVQPLAAAGQDQMAADTIRARATNPTTLDTVLAPANAEIVPGSHPTTFQQTGDMGLGVLEREQATKNPGAFNQRRADQNQARIGALTDLQAGANPDDVGTFLRGQFQNFDNQTQQHIDTLTAQAQQQAEALGGAGTPEAHGAALRGALQQGENAARGRERGLWGSLDPDNSIRIDASPTFQAANDIQSGMSRFAAPMDGDEQGIFDSLTGSKSLSLGELGDLRSRVSTAARKELTTNGNSPSYARLIRLRGAIQNNLADAATNQASQDAVQVANGTLAPEQTFANKVLNWQQDYYGNKAAQSLAGGATSLGTGTGSGPLADAGLYGTESAAGAGPRGASGASPIPSRSLTQEDADKLTAATQATKDRAQTYGTGPIKQVLAKAGMQDVYRLPEARVPEKFFHAGPTSASDIQTLRQTIGDGAALPILQDYAAGSLRKAAERPDGTLDPRKVAAWQNRYGNALRALPDLNAKFSTAADASNAIAESTAARSDAIADRNSSALGKVVNAQNADDVTRTIGGILGSKNATQSMQDLVRATSASPEATAGLRQAVADHITKNFVSNTEAGTSGTNLLKSDAYQSFLKKNRSALSQVFPPEEMGTLDRIGADLNRANRSVTAVKLPGGSNTPQDLHAASDPNATVLDRAINEAAAAGAGAAVGHAAGAGLSWMGAKVANAFRASGLKKVDDLITHAMLNPDLARDLLRRAPAQPDSGQSVALASRLRRIGMATLATQLSAANQRQGYKAGGHVHAAANEADREPSDAQIEAGNYRKGHVSLHGFDISIETPKGAARRGTGADGKPWENRHPTAHYGYLRGHGADAAADGEAHDAYIGPHPDSRRVFVVNQTDPKTKRFDEHKLIFGARSPGEARAIYDHGFSDGSGPKRRWALHETDPESLKAWLAGPRAHKPFPSTQAIAA